MCPVVASTSPSPAPRKAALRRLLVVDGDAGARGALQLQLSQGGAQVVGADGAVAGLRELDGAGAGYDGVLCEAGLLAANDFALLAELVRRDPPLVVIAVADREPAEQAIDAVERGAFDALVRPLRPDDLWLALRRGYAYLSARRDAAAARRSHGGGIRPVAPPTGLVGASAPMQAVLRTIDKVADVKTSVLIMGESGTGKELVARALHAGSSRAGAAFVAVNCGAIPPTLLESELFGHVRGSFTDAVRDKKGLFEEADGGTLFLDEIGELPLGLQVKLLRALQEEEVRRIGDTQSIHIDVRVVAATVRDLPAEVRTGRFREDLYYRLAVMPIELPPLRERKQDVPTLVDHFVRVFAAKHLDARARSVAPDALELLVAYDWPGNVRELENTIERAMVLGDSDRIELPTLEDKIRDVRAPAGAAAPAVDLSIKKTTRVVEEDLIRRALSSTGGNRTAAAKILEISHRALLYKIKSYGINM